MSQQGWKIKQGKKIILKVEMNFCRGKNISSSRENSQYRFYRFYRRILTLISYFMSKIEISWKYASIFH